MRLDEGGRSHILDEKGCRGRLSGAVYVKQVKVQMVQKVHGAGTDHQPPLMLTTRATSPNRKINRVYRTHCSAGAGPTGIRETVKPKQS